MGNIFHSSWSIFLAIFLVESLFLPQTNAEESAGDESCDFFQGSWVLDNSYPLYDTSICTFIDKEFDCRKNGRPDELYLKYRWKPGGCDMPRFDGRDFLNKMKGKKILFAGDSLSLNQWQSLACMLHASVPQSNYTLKGTSFTFPEYGVSLTLNRTPFLVDVVKENIGRVLKLDSIENGNMWKGYDMLIFNTWHWWLHTGKKQPWDYIEKEGKMYKDMDRLKAFKEGLTTWSKWVSSNIDPAKTSVFFQGISPTHYKGKEWNGSKSATCKGQTQPLTGSTYPGGSLEPAKVVSQVLHEMPSNTRVTLIDVTTLSQLRKDGHPSSYGNDGKKGNDCSHWCLAGVPDTWNELLYALFVTKEPHPKKI